MPKRKGDAAVASKAWNLWRLALSWARKAVVFKGLRDHKAPTDDRIHYLERQLSFDRTPDSHVKKDRRLTSSTGFLFPCVGAKAVEFDYAIAAHKRSYLTEEEEEEEEDDDDECNGCDKKSQSEDEGIDSRAEKFIAEFYGQTRLRN